MNRLDGKVDLNGVLKRKIRKNLLRWFGKNARDLPWRRTRDPYAIWVSEIMLQQTQVETVIPYYQRFMKSFPTVRRLARADLSRVLKAWEGLGYYSRARNLHRAAWMILSEQNGKIPATLEGLLKFPGIGRYTAGAILSIAFGQDAPILDGNAKRVLSRLFALSYSLGRRKTEDKLWELSASLIPKGRAGDFNQAVMELGAMICTPKSPECNDCPLARLCRAKSHGNPENYPARQARKKIPHILAVAAVIQKDGKVLLIRRPPKGLLGGLWEFPNWKVADQDDPGKEVKGWIRSELKLSANRNEPLGAFKQTFSHFRLSLNVYRMDVSGRQAKGKWVPVKSLPSYPMSRIHRRIADCLR